MGAYAYPQFPYTGPADLQAGAPQRRPLIVVGAGPVGLAAAIDARLQGLPVIVFDEDDTVSIGSRAVCYAKRALEILDRLGVGEPVCQQGVGWNVGRTFLGEQEVYRFDLVPEPGHKRPGMINLQQYYLEEMLVARARELGADLRWKYKVISVKPGATPQDAVTLHVETPDGSFDIEADWLVVADGARSPIRRMLGLEVDGRIFMDRFLIADVIMQADYPAERWLWFDPPFHRNQTVLLHKQSANVWRIDFQLGWDADPEEEKKPEKVIPRLKAMLGEDRPFELEWVSIYTFQCRRMQRFNHGRVLFAGDAAHQVSPFGARGANSGIQDADNLAWKLRLVIAGQAPPALLDTYSEERGAAADENIRNSTRSTDFITPKSAASRTFRDAVLALAADHPFARALVNSGRLSVPTWLADSRLNTPDTDIAADAFAGQMIPGAPMADAPVAVDGAHGWLLRQLGNRFHALHCTDDASRLDATAVQALRGLAGGAIGVQALVVARRGQAPGGLKTVIDTQGLVAERYDLRPGTTYLARPDQHVAARWRALDAAQVRAAVARATCNA